MDFTRVSKKDATLATVVYADIFDYPLTRGELHRWMILSTSRPMLTKRIDTAGGYFFLKGRSALVKLRARRKLYQEEKWNIARRAARLLSLIPTMQLIGVTGGLAMNNARREDDIDLFLIVSGGTLWISRLLTTLLMDVFSMRRHPHDVRVRNKVCLNMFVTEQGMTVSKGERDCFAAHEVLQMKPVWEKAGVYQRFLQANSWVKEFLPNAWKETYHRARSRRSGMQILRLLEPPARNIQLWYMRGGRTNEVITDTALRFHPKDARVWIKKKLTVRLRRFNIPLDNIFYGR